MRRRMRRCFELINCNLFMLCFQKECSVILFLIHVISHYVFNNIFKRKTVLPKYSFLKKEEICKYNKSYKTITWV